MNHTPLDANPANKSKSVRIARIYSNVFSPPSLYAIFGFVIAWFTLPFWIGSLHAVIFGILASLLPILYIVHLLRTGKISDLHISNQNERHIPYVLGITGAGLALLILMRMNTPRLMQFFVIADILALTLLAILNIFWLVSAHMTGISIITTFASFAFGLKVGLFLIPIVGITFGVRLFLKRHTIPELISGTLLGVIIVSGLAYFGAFH